jgi:DNA-binding MarR family transcriptional regulator
MDTISQRACQDILQLLDCVKRAMMELAEEQGLTRTQVFMLYILDQRGETTMRDAADMLHCDASNITGLVDRMVAQDLVVRQSRQDDRRAKKICLTAKGQEVVARLHQALPAKLHCEKLDATECASLRHLVQKICMLS